MSTTSGAQAPPKDKLIFAPGTAPDDAHAPPRAAQFSLSRLRRSDLSPDPFTQFHSWFTHPGLQGHVPETVTLSTAELPSGRISSRTVYLKELDTRGFVVYSNFGTSRKAADIATNPRAALCFWWKPLERQVRVEGPTERLTPQESQVYFDTRARGSRIGAWASQQSSVLQPVSASGHAGSGHGNGNSNDQTQQNDGNDENAEDDDGRLQLETTVKEIEKRFEGQDKIPVPPFWGGLRIIPESVEFWQGRESRLHDRFVYTRLDGDAGWKIERLSP